jgi:hypothetical protein
MWSSKMARSQHPNHQETTPQQSSLSEIHPAAATFGQETVIISCRALRANAQYTAKRLVPAAGQTGPQEARLTRLSSLATAQESVSGQAEAPGTGHGTQNQPRGRYLGQGEPGQHARHRRCPRRGRWEALEHQEPAEDRAVVARTAAVVHHLQISDSGYCCHSGRRSLHLTDLPRHLAGWNRLYAVLQTQGARLSLPGLWFRLSIAMGLAVPTCSPNILRENQGTSNHLLKSIVTPTWGSVVAWTRRIPLGFQPLARTHPRSCGASAPAECHKMPVGYTAAKEDDLAPGGIINHTGTHHFWHRRGMHLLPGGAIPGPHLVVHLAPLRMLYRRRIICPLAAS